MTYPPHCPTPSSQDRAHPGRGIERELFKQHNKCSSEILKWQTNEIILPTCYNALHGDVAALAEPQRGVSVLVQPLPISLCQQLLVVVGEVVHVKVLYSVVLQKNICKSDQCSEVTSWNWCSTQASVL